MKLVVGLGNPGPRYSATRHNVGFRAIDALVERHGAGVAPKATFESESYEVRIEQQKVLLLKPQTFMNLSGRSVRAAVNFYKLPLEDLMVVCDDLNLPTAKLRLRGKGSAGGQNGLDHIIQLLGNQNFPRLRIGIGRPPEHWDPKDYVLGKFTRNEEEEASLAIARAADAVELWMKEGLTAAMNQFN